MTLGVIFGIGRDLPGVTMVVLVITTVLLRGKGAVIAKRGAITIGGYHSEMDCGVRGQASYVHADIAISTTVLSLGRSCMRIAGGRAVLE